MVGLHSPWGIIDQIREKKGYTFDYILWAEPWANYLLASADAPRYVKGVPSDERVFEDSEEVQSKLGNRVKVL